METFSYRTRLPVLVYGTLRPGQPNHRLLRNRSRYLGDTTVSGYEMYDNGAYPYAVDALPDQSIMVSVIDVFPHVWRSVIDDLDMLEGFYGIGAENHYFRRAVPYVLDGERREGWLFVADTYTRGLIARRHLPLVPSGDWLAR